MDDTGPLSREIDGARHAGRIVLVHGFTQTRNCWGEVAENLASDHEVVRVDAPGHGRSGHAEADMWQGAQLIGTVGGPATYVGYSMGGRFCLHLALERPDLVEQLVLLGASPGIVDGDERARRADLDDSRAAHLEEVGLEVFLDEWLAQPLFADLPPDRACREARLENTVAGLASSLRRAGTGRQEPLWDRLVELGRPVLCLAGRHDRRFAAIADRMAAIMGPTATSRVVPDAGHCAHLAQPAAFLLTLRRWLDGG